MTPTRPRIAAALALCVTLCTAIAAAVWFAARQPDTEDAIARALDATLVLRSADGTAFLGSAILWQGGEVAITNSHVLAGHTQVQVTTRDDTTAIARVTARDDKRDIALLSLPRALGPGLTPAPAPGIGGTVIATGAPLEAGFTATRGILSAHRQVLPAVPLRFLQHDAAINPGSSGGPLINADGALIGMNTRIADGSRFYVGISYAIPAPLIATFVAGDLPPVAELGLALRPLDGAMANALGVHQATGLLIDDVTPDGAAHEAGLRPGDILLAANGQHLTRPGDLSMAVADAPATLPLLVRRDAQQVTLTLAIPPAAPTPPAPASRAVPTPKTATFADLGVTLDGPRIAAIDDTGLGYAAGLAQGDRIVAVGTAPFTGQPLTLPALLRISRDTGTTHILIDPARRTIRPLGGGNAIDPDVTLF